MLILRHNTLDFHELLVIERKMLKVADVSHPLDGLIDLVLLDMPRAEVYGFILGLFERLDLCRAIGITSSELLDFIIDVDKGYLPNAYHSFYHAADVTVVLFAMLADFDAKQYLTSVDMATLLIAALCHDIGHPGKNNNFQVNIQTELAKRYNNKSVLECYSCTLTMDLLTKHQLLQHIERASMEAGVPTTEDEARTSIIKMILATDMIFHYELQENLAGLLEIISDRECTETEKEQGVRECGHGTAGHCNGSQTWDKPRIKDIFYNRNFTNPLLYFENKLSFHNIAEENEDEDDESGLNDHQMFHSSHSSPIAPNAPPVPTAHPIAPTVHPIAPTAHPIAPTAHPIAPTAPNTPTAHPTAPTAPNTPPAPNAPHLLTKSYSISAPSASKSVSAPNTSAARTAAHKHTVTRRSLTGSLSIETQRHRSISGPIGGPESAPGIITESPATMHATHTDSAHLLQTPDSAKYRNCSTPCKLLSKLEREVLCQIMLHAADISNALRPWSICKTWSNLVCEEFFGQGDAEKASGLPISPNMDRGQTTQATISLKFGDYIVNPYFEIFAAVFPKSDKLLQLLAENRKEWVTLENNNNKADRDGVDGHSKVLPDHPILDPAGRRVSTSAGMIVIPAPDEMERRTVGFGKAQRTYWGVRSASHSEVPRQNAPYSYSIEEKKRRKSEEPARFLRQLQLTASIRRGSPADVTERKAKRHNSAVPSCVSSRQEKKPL
ncbi:hypothetical protein CLU79DRAFT_762470 [Phycomyces nitens]|nr:hypothetical protein CLU79DRAFT_762470 [Phycomyces nitens]